MIAPRPVDQLFTGRREAIAGEYCRRCGEPKGTFTDVDSENEYYISGICEPCQAIVFTCVHDWSPLGICRECAEVRP